MKIQDGMGRRLIPLIVEVMEADTSEMTFLDKLNRIEKIGLIGPGEWNTYRKIRNDLAHTIRKKKKNWPMQSMRLRRLFKNSKQFFRKCAFFAGRSWARPDRLLGCFCLMGVRKHQKTPHRVYRRYRREWKMNGVSTCEKRGLSPVCRPRFACLPRQGEP